MTRKRPSLPVLAALVALVAATLAACSSGGGKAAGPITLSFLANDDGKPVQQLIAAFEKANPNIKVTTQGVAVADTLTKARSAVQSSAGLDVAQIDWTEMSLAYQELPIVPVQKIAGSGWHATEAGFNQAILKATSYGGATVAMPYTTSVPTLFYNPTLFKAAGLDPNTPPATMDQVSADALAIVKQGAQGVYFDVADAAKSDVLTQSLIDGTGGAVIADNGVITVDQPPAVAAMQEMANLTRSGAQPASGEADAVAAFHAGKLGMLVTSTSQLPSLDAATKGKFTIMAGGFPAYGNQPARPTYSGSGLVITTRDAARQQAAWKFVQFLTGEQAFTTLTSKIGYLPLRPDAVTNQKYLAKYFKADKRLLPALSQLNSVTTYTFFRGPNATQAVAALQDDAVTPIALQGQAAWPALSKVANTIRNLVGE